MQIRLLEHNEYPLMLPLLIELNPNTDPELLRSRLDLIKNPGYQCVAVFLNDKVVGICGMWIMAKIYTGMQMEIDNVAVDPAMRSKKIGNAMMNWVYNYAKELGCTTVELNTYVGNHRSHKFYYNEGFKILGFHMQKVM